MTITKAISIYNHISELEANTILDSELKTLKATKDLNIEHIHLSLSKLNLPIQLAPKLIQAIF